MYTPKFNQVTDRNILIEAMRANSFAILFGPLGNAETAGAQTQLIFHSLFKTMANMDYSKVTSPRPIRIGKPSPVARRLSSFPVRTAMYRPRSTRSASLSLLGTTSPFTFTGLSNSSSMKQKSMHSLTDSFRPTTPLMPTNGTAFPVAIEALCLRASLVSVFPLLASKGNSN